MRAKVTAENERIASQGRRVLAFAQREFDPATFDPSADLMALMQDLEMAALVGEVDPPRAEAMKAIAVAKRAGIRVRMITGDHAITAGAIAHELGIEGRAVTGAEFAAFSDEEAARQIDDIGVIARVAPEHKVRLVEVLKAKHNVVAMTGDGVNDAPAIAAADIGIAMGITGTDVAKGAAKMILADDNFATIMAAVEEGRVDLRQPAEVHPHPGRQPVHVHPRVPGLVAVRRSPGRPCSARRRCCGSTWRSSRPSAR